MHTDRFGRGLVVAFQVRDLIKTRLGGSDKWESWWCGGGVGVGTSEGDLSNSVCFGKQFLRRGRIYISACPTKEEKDYPIRGKYHRYRYNDFGDDRKQVEHLSGEVKVKQTNKQTHAHRHTDR